MFDAGKPFLCLVVDDIPQRYITIKGSQPLYSMMRVDGGLLE